VTSAAKIHGTTAVHGAPSPLQDGPLAA
jgi:hypothetical protein